jgi:hypothetical protein
MGLAHWLFGAIIYERSSLILRNTPVGTNSSNLAEAGVYFVSCLALIGVVTTVLIRITDHQILVTVYGPRDNSYI